MKRFSLLLISSAIDDPYVRERYRNAGIFLAPSIGLYRLKCYIENLQLAAVDIFDPNLHREDVLKALIQQLTNYGRYDIIGFSPTHVNLGYDLNLIWAVYEFYQQKQLPQPLYIAGGHEATNNYHELFRLFRPLRCSVLGPGEHPLEAIITRVRIHTTNASLDFSGIPGTVVKDPSNSKLIRYDAIPENIGTFRTMAFHNDPTHLIPYHLYWNQVAALYSQANLSSRGATLRCIRLYTANHCRMQCGFCTSNAFHKNACGGSNVPVARLTPEQMIALIKKCWAKHHPDGFYFNDDDFIGDSLHGRTRVIEFCQHLEKAKADGEEWANVSLYCQTQALWLTTKHKGQLIPDMELIENMQRGGFKLVCMGIENLSARLLTAKSIQKSYNPLHATTAIKGLQKIGIIPLINIILFPPEVREDDLIINIKECAYLISRGVIISMQEFIEIFPGSLLHKDIISGRRILETIHDIIPIRFTGESVTFNERVLPVSKKMRKIVRAFYSELDEVNSYLREKPWFPFDVTPKHLNALAMLMATARLLERKDDITYIEETIHQICERCSKG